MLPGLCRRFLKPKGPTTAILILGMHRRGTSSLTGSCSSGDCDSASGRGRNRTGDTRIFRAFRQTAFSACFAE